MDIPLGKSNNDAGFTEEIVNVKSDIAFNDPTIHDVIHCDPKIEIKYKGIIPEIIEQHEGFGIMEDLLVL